MKMRMRRERHYMDGKRDICVYVCMYVALGRYIWPSINQPVHLCKVRNFPSSHSSSASFSHKWFSKSLAARHIHSVLTGVIFCQRTSTVAPLFTVNLVFQSKDSNILEVCTHSPFFLALHFLPVMYRSRRVPLILLSLSPPGHSCDLNSPRVLIN